MNTYEEFIARKKLVVKPSGLDELPPLNPYLKPFQSAIVTWALRQGRCAIFASTGLGKTLMELSFGRALYQSYGIHSLCLTPLAVAEEAIAESQKFSVEGVAYAKRQSDAYTPIVVTNYERFAQFDIDRYDCIILDESSILKSEDGATRKLLTDACRRVKWKLCATATPAPNDYTELGQHAEFLGVMTAKEMLSTFFVKDDSTRMEGNPIYRLKRHASRDFWEWLASWSVMIRKPEDLGFDAPEYELPPLHYRRIAVEAAVEPPSGSFFPDRARTLRDRIRARRATVDERVAKVLEIVNREPNEPWLLWCNLNDEADVLEKKLSNALQVAGSQPVETKVERLMGFKTGHPLIMITKPNIAAHGMNYQHCSRMIFVGVSDSFEAQYQAIRRCWRFGQTKEVIVYFVYSDIEGNVIQNVKRKEVEFESMLDEMSVHMIDIMRENIRGAAKPINIDGLQVPMEIPKWLTTLSA